MIRISINLQAYLNKKTYINRFIILKIDIAAFSKPFLNFLKTLKNDLIDFACSRSILLQRVEMMKGIKNDRKYFLPREIENHNVLIDGRNFYDQPINDLIKQYDEVRKVSTGYGDDCTTGCLLDYAYFKDNYRLIAVDLSKKKALDADPRAIQQTVFQGIARGENNTKIRLYTILEKSKETILEFAKGTVKVW